MCSFFTITQMSKSVHVHMQRNVTDAQPHASFGSGPLFPSPVEGVLDLTGNDQARYPLLLSYDTSPVLCLLHVRGLPCCCGSLCCDSEHDACGH